MHYITSNGVCNAPGPVSLGNGHCRAWDWVPQLGLYSPNHRAKARVLELLV